jgi:hypothetical protein
MARKTKSAKRQRQTAATSPPPPSQEAPAPVAAATINIESSNLNPPKDHIQVQTEDVEILEDALSLYKGKSFLELSFAERSLIAEDGSINIMQLASVQGGDFNWANPSISSHEFTNLQLQEVRELHTQKQVEWDLEHVDFTKNLPFRHVTSGRGFGRPRRC